MMEFVSGNLLNANVDAICHQVNCLGVMGAGIAAQIKRTWPHVFREYAMLCKNADGLLGTIQTVSTGSGNTDIVNVFSQFGIGRGVQTDYEALHKALRAVNNQYSGKTVGIPYKMSCGLAGGDWATVKSIICEELTACDVRVYVLPGTPVDEADAREIGARKS